MNLTETEKKIINQVKNEVRSTPKLISKKLNLSTQHIRNLMSNLCRFGFLKRITRGVYEATATQSSKIRATGKKAKEVYNNIMKEKI